LVSGFLFVWLDVGFAFDNGGSVGLLESLLS